MHEHLGYAPEVNIFFSNKSFFLKKVFQQKNFYFD